MKAKPTQRRAKRLGAAATAAALLLQTVMPVYAGVSQLPGLYTTPPDANVMFTLDDSLSMYSDAIPDFISDQTGMPNQANDSVDSDALSGNAGNQGARFPGMWKQNTLYWGPTYYRSDNNIARYMRSAAGNPLYYNPKVVYTPWPTAADDKQFHLNANPAAVNIHPSDPFNAGFTRNLTVRVGAAGEANGFWPATYYVYKGATPLPMATPNTPLNTTLGFDKFEIEGSGTTTFAKASTRTDCVSTPGVCTRVEELQNFANWLQYYRSRMLMAKGGVSAAFAQQLSNLRLGFATINSNPTVRQGVATYAGTRRTDFYNDLYAIPGSSGGTPLRRAMDDVGQYFERSDAGNPWAEDPTSGSIGKEYTCRKSFHILSTDGFWNGGGASGARADNNDSFSGTTPAKPDGTTYAFSDTATGADPLTGRFTINPFTDGNDKTLADVAAYYWRNDLRALPNEVPSSTRDPAFWQHLSTYTVGLGVTGTGTVQRASDNSTVVPLSEPATSPLYAYRGLPWLEKQEVRDWLVANKVPLNWTTPSANAATTGDDLVHASMNGRGRYFSASDPTSLRNGLSSALAEATNNPGSLASIAVEAPQVSAASITEVYQATYNPSQWSGRLYAFSQSASGTVSTVPSTALWEASNKMPTPANRKIYTWNPGTTAADLFTWANLTATQQGNLNNDSTILDFLRGSDAQELAQGGSFRDRARYTVAGVTGGVLGDIVNGSPIKGPSAGGGFERLPPASAGQASYATYRAAGNTALDNMRDTLFVGANDGMLHAFDRNTGVERFAYVPNSVYNVPRSLTGTEPKLKMLSDPGYTHRFTVDGPPQIGDAFLGASLAASEWKTILVSSTGAGARSVFAMDISNPKDLADTAAPAGGFDKSKFLWEFSEANNADMGYVINYPHIARMRDGSWVALFGNGYDSVNGQAKLFILDLRTGAVLWQQSVGAAGGNGLSQPNFTVNDKREVTAIYAGDLKGNLWKFDVDDANPTNWKVAFGSAPNYAPLYTGSTLQPITVMPELTPHPNGGWVVSYGTGKLFETEDTAATVVPNVNLNTQAIYGIWDKPSEATGFSSTATLVQHVANTALGAAADTTLSGTTTDTVDWASKRGWFIELPAAGERVNVNPQQAKLALLVVANRPDSDPCKTGGSSRLFALDPVTGNAPDFAVFDADQVGGITTADKGYNVKAISFAVLSLPTLQSKKTFPDVVMTEKIGSRGQTGDRLGGVENKPVTATDCAQWLLAGGSDTTITGFDISLCSSGKPRISWRQLK